MPYRRLPNTDTSRLRAINTAIQKAKSTSDSELAISFTILQKIEFFQPKFILAIKNLKDAKKKQVSSSKDYNEKFKKAKIYISHFIQAVNFCILREEMKESCREFYNIDPKDKTVPPLTHDIDILKWGDLVTKGEQKRMYSGGNPIYTPSIANVSVNYTKFKNAYHMQKQLQKNTKRFSDGVAILRNEADSLIQKLWNEIEGHYANIDNENKRRLLCEEYGIKYVFRRHEVRPEQENEVKNLNLDGSEVFDYVDVEYMN